MQLNPYNFRQYLSRTSSEPHLSAWVMFAVVCGFLAWWVSPYIAPSSVTLRLPQQLGVTLRTPPSAFVVFTGDNFIYRAQVYNLTQLFDALKDLPKKEVLLLAVASNTSMQELLPLLQRLEQLKFKEVAFTVRP